MKVFHVEQMKNIDGQYFGEINESIDQDLANTLKDGGRMIVDSDKKAFIYIIENEDELFYVYFFEHTWQQLKEIYEQEADVFLQINNDLSIKLETMSTELSFLVENIKGNGNYGEVMERAVQQVFG